MHRRIMILCTAIGLFMLLTAFTFVPVLHVYAQEAVDEATLLDIAQSYTDDIWNANDLTVGETLFADDFVDHHPIPGQLLGREGYIDTVILYRTAFPDLQVQNDDVFANGDRVTVRWTAVGTHQGDLLGIPASENPVTITGIDILRIADGQIVERWAEDNALQLMQQIGAFGAVEILDLPGAPITEEAAAHFVERLTALFDAPNLDIADELFAPDTVNHLPLAPNLDLEAWKAYIASFYVGIPDLRDQVKQVIIASDRLVLHSTYSGTHTGVLFGVPATGNPVSLDGITIFRFNEAGLVVEAWAVIDVVGLLAQIGAFPPAQ